MARSLTRRRALLALGASAVAATAAPAPPTVHSHVHLFDPARVPYAPDAPYKPAAYTLEDHLKLVEHAPLAHSIIVHPEPYQDDHRYVEYCLAHQPAPGYLKATCMFDPLKPDTPDRMRRLLGRWPKRIVALRIHEMSMTPENAGPIRNRDMKDPRMEACWGAVTSLGMAVQMHFIPGQAPAIHRLASQFSGTAVILDHMGRPGQGTAAEYDEVLKLAALPRVILKYSGWEYYKGDMHVLTRRLYDTFGPDRMIWGMVGATPAGYQKQSAQFEEFLTFASQSDRAKIRGGNAQRLFFS
ncbi:MAG TPA: amidohydrolase family protein [Bryobacteraceae bacterium]|nr:amidohydrolase family protein [Bryobacteraceae bacterium]